MRNCTKPKNIMRTVAAISKAGYEPKSILFELSSQVEEVFERTEEDSTFEALYGGTTEDEEDDNQDDEPASETEQEDDGDDDKEVYYDAISPEDF